MLQGLANKRVNLLDQNVGNFVTNNKNNNVALNKLNIMIVIIISTFDIALS